MNLSMRKIKQICLLVALSVNSLAYANQPASELSDSQIPVQESIQTVDTRQQYSVIYDLESISNQNSVFTGSGSGRFDFQLAEGHYQSSLETLAKVSFIKVKIAMQSSGEVDLNNFRTLFYSSTLDAPFLKRDREKEFEVNYQTHEIILNNMGERKTIHFDEPYLLDELSIIGYVQLKLQRHDYQAGLQKINIPIFLKDKVTFATIQIGQPEVINTAFRSEIATVPVNIKLSKKNSNPIKVWYATQDDFLPLKIEWSTDKTQTNLLAKRIER